jgi:hypothetical protein
VTTGRLLREVIDRIVDGALPRKFLDQPTDFAHRAGDRDPEHTLTALQ